MQLILGVDNGVLVSPNVKDNWESREVNIENVIFPPFGFWLLMEWLRLVKK